MVGVAWTLGELILRVVLAVGVLAWVAMLFLSAAMPWRLFVLVGAMLPWLLLFYEQSCAVERMAARIEALEGERERIGAGLRAIRSGAESGDGTYPTVLVGEMDGEVRGP